MRAGAARVMMAISRSVYSRAIEPRVVRLLRRRMDLLQAVVAVVAVHEQPYELG